MVKFNVGDVVYKDNSDILYTVEAINEATQPMPQYKLVHDNFSFWDYCIGWKELVTKDDALRYGEVLTDDRYYNGSSCRIRTICYDNRIFYHKMVNGEVVEFKELMM